MERDDLREAWASLEAHVEKTERLNDLLVAQSMSRKAETSLMSERRTLWLELLLNYAAVVALGSFGASHVHDTAAVVSAAILDAALIAYNAVAIGILIGLHSIDYDEPVVAIQSALQRVKMRRVKLTAVTLLAAPLLWTPLFIVLIALAGGNAMRLGPAYIVANVTVGITLCAGGLIVARSAAARFSDAGWWKKAVDALSGKTYAQASDFLDTIARFRDAA